ncbi:hypothetical protein [Streptomyces sp. DG1A-41]|uniref:hypothetical protein n=1 Tax=Streptomyces sp. DG1A-41 TaxID=3125779 RepID=UPI0030D44A79
MSTAASAVRQLDVTSRTARNSSAVRARTASDSAWSSDGPGVTRTPLGQLPRSTCSDQDAP